MKKRKKGCVIAALILVCIIFVIAAGTFYYFDVLQLKGDNARTRFNIKLVYKHLEQYHYEHGAYPPQQDMKTLLKTLGMSKSDFEKTVFFDISSAEYHASNRNQEDSAQNMDDPVLSIRVKSHIFGNPERLCVRKDGSVYRDSDTDSRP
ncbi:hypothetical protein J5681_03775 [bacterium]|nr:hypothetical protein [bacterium]